MRLNASDYWTLVRVKEYCQEIERLAVPRGLLAASKHRAAVRKAAQTLKHALDRLTEELDGDPRP